MDTLPLKILQFLKKYIELDTSRTDGKNYPKAIALLSDFLTKINFVCEELAIPEKIAGGPNRVHLIAKKIINTSLPTLVIYNHIDVVPATYPGAFEWRIDSKKIHGRGSCDHKGSTAAILSALLLLKSEKLRFNVVFIATTDEETNQTAQLKFLSKKLKLPKNSFIFDPDTFAGGITVAHLGCVQLEVTVHGKSAHSAASHFGVNAIEQSAKLLEFFASEKALQEKTVSKQKPFPSSKMDSVVSRCNVNMISGGIAPNVVPDILHLTVDYRFIPEQFVQEEKIKIFQRFEAFCKKTQLSYKIESVAEHEGYTSSDKEIDRLLEISNKYITGSGKFCVMGSTPAAQWAKELGLPHFGIGVARGDTNMHAIGEFAYLEDFFALEKVFSEFIQQ